MNYIIDHISDYGFHELAQIAHLKQYITSLIFRNTHGTKFMPSHIKHYPGTQQIIADYFQFW